ncbi:MAG: HisA/HisF-related TIM barrel protein [Candidatus Bathyarchaeota archaeon]|nr:HisA/HisF-related TIM barrel protein [Candidatus Bathyarchaeota archaeon]
MDTMKIIPVIDILNGKVVHAKGGIRNEYQPLKTSLFASSNPIDIVIKLEKMGFKDLYLADLDSIIKKQTNFSLLENIRDSSKIDLMVDAGVTNKDLAIRLFKRNVTKVIVGTETLVSIVFLKDAVEFFGKDKIIVSLDLANGKILNRFNLKGQKRPEAFLETVENLGVSQIIILDLARVGSKKGVNIQLIKKILRNLKLDVYVGGGIRDIEDLIELKQLGVSGSLIGTALYSKTIDIDDLRNKKLIS